MSATDAPIVAKEGELPLPFQLVSVPSAREQLYALSAVFACIIVLALACLIRRWRQGACMFLTARAGVVVPATTTWLLFIFVSFACTTEVFIWRLIRIFGDKAEMASMVPVWVASWSLLVAKAYVELWGLCCAINFRPGKLRLHMRRIPLPGPIMQRLGCVKGSEEIPLLIPACIFNLLFCVFLPVGWLSVIITVGVKCTIACRDIYRTRSTSAPVAVINEAIRRCMFWARLKDILFASALLLLIIGHLSAYLILRERMRAEARLLRQQHARWHAQKELLRCDNGWADLRGGAAPTLVVRPPSHNADASDGSPATSSLSSESLPAVPSPAAFSANRTSPLPKIGPMYLSTSTKDDMILCRAENLPKDDDRRALCPGQRALRIERSIRYLGWSITAVVVALLTFLAIACVMAASIGKRIALDGTSTALVLWMLWIIPVGSLPKMVHMLRRPASENMLATPPVPVVIPRSSSEKPTETDNEEDDEEEIFDHPFSPRWLQEKGSSDFPVRVSFPVSPRGAVAPGSGSASSGTASGSSGSSRVSHTPSGSMHSSATSGHPCLSSSPPQAYCMSTSSGSNT